MDHTPEQITQMLHDPEIPALYVNGFLAVGGKADIALILTAHGQPVAKVSMAHMVAASLADELAHMRVTYEAHTGQTVSTFRALDAYVQRHRSDTDDA